MSEANVVQKAAKAGDDSLNTEAFRARHDSEMRLSAEGVEQARSAGAWIRSEILGREDATAFDRTYFSPHVRAVETAAHLGLGITTWRENDLVRERDWGVYASLTLEERDREYARDKAAKEQNAWYWAAPGGESLATGVRLRFERFLDTLHREAAGHDVLVVTHGEFMWVARFVLERLSVREWLQLDDRPDQRIVNGAVLHYTRVNPMDPNVVASRLTWRRIVCPWDPALSPDGGRWVELSFGCETDADLLAAVARVPRLVGE